MRLVAELREITSRVDHNWPFDRIWPFKTNYRDPTVEPFKVPGPERRSQPGYLCPVEMGHFVSIEDRPESYQRERKGASDNFRCAHDSREPSNRHGIAQSEASKQHDHRGPLGEGIIVSTPPVEDIHA